MVVRRFGRNHVNESCSRCVVTYIDNFQVLGKCSLQHHRAYERCRYHALLWLYLNTYLLYCYSTANII